MRTWGRIPGLSGGIGTDFAIGVSPIGGTDKPQWVQVETDANGYNDAVWLTTLVQCLKLNLGESPFYADYGIPARLSVLQQIAPDFYATRTQQQFAGHFASLIITREELATEPTYAVAVITEQGSVLSGKVPV